MAARIQIADSTFGKGTAIWEGDHLTLARGLERIPLNDILPLEDIGGAKRRTFTMHLRDGRSFKCSMPRHEYGELIKRVGVKDKPPEPTDETPESGA